MATADERWIALEDAPVAPLRIGFLWLVALAAYGVGDVVTTISLVWFDPLYVEGNPVVAAAIDHFGGGGFLALKLLAIYGCLAVSVWGAVHERDPVLCYGPPIVVATFGMLATGHNLVLML